MRRRESSYLCLLSASHFANSPWVDSLRSEHCFSDNAGLIIISEGIIIEIVGLHLHDGRVSSHFFFLFRQVKHPVLLRPFGAFDTVDGGVLGCFLGLPRGRRVTVPPGVCVVSTSPSSRFLCPSGGLSILVSTVDSSSNSSIFGMTLWSRGDVELSCM